VKITVTNVGGSPAQNASAMLVNPNTVFVVKGDKTSDLGTIAPGESQSVSFQVTAASDITDATSYSMWLYFSYRRVDGNTLTYSEGDHESFSIRTKDTIQTTKQEQVVEYKAGTSQSTVDFGAIILGVLILIGMIIIARTFRRPAPPAPPQSLPPQPSMMVPPPPPPPQMEQQYAQPPYIQPPTQ